MLISRIINYFSYRLIDFTALLRHSFATACAKALAVAQGAAKSNTTFFQLFSSFDLLPITLLKFFNQDEILYRVPVADRFSFFVFTE
jgi:hypothetical protein